MGKTYLEKELDPEFLSILTKPPAYYFAKLVRYMKNVYRIESGLNKLSDGRES